MQSFEGFKDLMNILHPSKDCMLLRRFDQMIMWDFEGLKEHMQHYNQTFEGLCDPLKSWKTIRNPSNESSNDIAILRIVEGLRLWSFEGLKDCIQSFNLLKNYFIIRRVEGLDRPSKDCECNPSNLLSIVNVILWRVEWLCDDSTLRRIV